MPLITRNGGLLRKGSQLAASQTCCCGADGSGDCSQCVFACTGYSLNALYITAKTTIDPFSAAITWTFCSGMSGTTTFSTAAYEQTTNHRLTNTNPCSSLIIQEPYARSAFGPRWYEVVSNRWVYLTVGPTCTATLSMQYLGSYSQESVFHCGRDVMQKLHDTDLSATPSASRSLSCPADLVGMKLTHSPDYAIPCAPPYVAGNLVYPPDYEFCESGGKMIVEIMSVSVLP